MFPTLIAQKLEVIREALAQDDVRLIVITGPPRKGKSTVALRIARYLDPTFNIEDRVVYSGYAFKLACTRAPPGSVILMDEAIKGGNSRRATSSENVSMMDWLAIWGHRNLCGIIVYPKWRRLDPAIKEFVHVRIHVGQRGIARWKDVFHPDHLDKPVEVPFRKFRFKAIPSGPFRAAYEVRKTEFTGVEAKMTVAPVKVDGRRKLTDKQRAELVHMVQTGAMNHAQAAARYGVSRPYVTQLVGSMVLENNSHNGVVGGPAAGPPPGGDAHKQAKPAEDPG